MKRLDVFGFSRIGTRQVNEDSFKYCRLSDSSAYAIVADGLGSHGAGDVASKIAVEALSAFTADAPLPDSEAIMSWTREANDRILATRDGAWHMKTTAVALYVSGGRAIWMHTGDSRLYHYHNGRLVDFTNDQSVCQLYVLQGMITRDQIPFSPDRNKILNVIGDENIRPVIHEAIELEPGEHAFLLCSDGIWERLREEEIGIDLDGCGTAEEWLNRLWARATLREYEHVDNNTGITMIVEV